MATRVQLSQATAKFQALYPTDHKLMINMINRARRRKGCPLCELEVRKELNTENTELINMRRNIYLVKLRDEDKLQEKRKESKLGEKEENIL